MREACGDLGTKYIRFFTGAAAGCFSRARADLDTTTLVDEEASLRCSSSLKVSSTGLFCPLADQVSTKLGAFRIATHLEALRMGIVPGRCSKYILTVKQMLPQKLAAV